ncbi:stage III sporulation protein AG [Virgibacillus sp. MSJ-26]|nr:stage III sporulation protein AG [Virgibacillus sp. MSJ-26]
MGGGSNLIKKIIEYFRSKDKSTTTYKKYSYLIVIGLIGLMLLLIGNIFTNSESEKDLASETPIPKSEAEQVASQEESTLTSNVDELESSYQKDLEEMLSKIQGVSDVEVMINLDSTNVKVYEKNLISGKQLTDENDKNGGERQIEDHTEETEVVVVRKGDQEVPLVVQTKKPNVRGVFVVAKGVDHATVKQWVVESTSRVLDVPTHRVSVMPKNKEE